MRGGHGWELEHLTIVWGREGARSERATDEGARGGVDVERGRTMVGTRLELEHMRARVG